MPALDNLQYRRGTAAAWTAADPVLLSGEPGWETDTSKLKVGDGATHWTSLAYWPASTGGIDAGVIVMWSGTLATVPTGWALCDGSGGTPDLRDLFVLGWTGGVDPGGTGGSPVHSHADHAGLAHSGAAVADHVVTQPDTHAGHSNHSVTQADTHTGHSNHSVTQPDTHAGHSNHSVTQPDGHSNHSVTQPNAHSAHAALGTHAHELPFIKLSGGTGAIRFLASTVFGTGTSRAPESTATPAANTTAGVVLLSEAVSAGTPDAHSAHAGTAVDAHSAHAGTAVDAHSAHAAHANGAVDAHSAHPAHTGTAVDAHSAHAAHANGAVSAHGVTQPSAHPVVSHAAGANVPAYYKLAFIIKT